MRKVQIVKMPSGGYTARYQKLFCWVYLTTIHRDTSMLMTYKTVKEAEAAARNEWGEPQNPVVIKEIEV